MNALLKLFAHMREYGPIMGVYTYSANRRIENSHRAEAWVTSELAKHGIVVTPCGDPQVIPHELDIPMAPEQYDVVGDVFARALKKFRPCPAELLCGGIRPVNPLNRAWAERYGIDTYAIPCVSGPCGKCGQTELTGHAWMTDEEFARETSSEGWPGMDVSRAHFQFGHARYTPNSSFICSKCYEPPPWARDTGQP